MNLNQLCYFKKLAELEHYTKAAEQLSISQPSLSHAISSLEEELGTFLFEKQGRNVRLTKYGRIYLEYVNKSLKELELGKAHLEKLMSASHGHINLSYISSIGSNFIPNLISSFLKKDLYKAVRFFCSENNTRKLLKNLKTEKSDLVFCSYMDNEPSVEFIPVCQQRLVVIVPKDHLLSKRDSISLKEIVDFNLIYYTKDSGLRITIDKLFAAIGCEPKISSEVEEDNSIAGLVQKGLGIAVVTDNYTIRNFDLKMISLEDSLCKRYVYLAFIKNRYLSPAAEAFKKHVIKEARLEDK